MGVSSFLFFRNLKMKQSKMINMIASSTFGVFLIHANSDTMRKWLWQTVLDVKGIYYESTFTVVIYAVFSVFVIFIICVIVDQIRISTIEKVVLDRADRGIHRFMLNRGKSE